MRWCAPTCTATSPRSSRARPFPSPTRPASWRGAAAWTAIGAFAIACFAFGLLLAVATGGNELVFKLREEIWSGPAGPACLISVAVGRPLFLVALQLAARRNAEIAGRISGPQARRIPAVTTAAVGIILVVHAVVIAALALTVSTTVFLAAKAPISLVIVGGGLAALVWWIRRQVTSRAGRPLPPGGAADASTVREEEDHHAHRHDPQNGRHQRAGRRGAAPRAG
jgi:hypothetical protein